MRSIKTIINVLNIGGAGLGGCFQGYADTHPPGGGGWRVGCQVLFALSLDSVPFATRLCTFARLVLVIRQFDSADSTIMLAIS